MTKISLFLGFFLVSFITSQSKVVNESPDLENYMNENDEEGGDQEGEAEEDDGEEEGTEEEEGDSQPEESIEESPNVTKRSKPVIPKLSPEEAFKAFNSLMSNTVSRTSLISISDKIKKLVLNNETKEALQNIMKNVNFMQVEPQFTKIMEEALVAWNHVIQDEDMQQMVKEAVIRHDELAKDPNIQKTVHVFKDAVTAVHDNDAAMKLIRASHKTAHKLVEQRQMVFGILTDTLRIFESPVKINFIIDTGLKMAPLFGNLKAFMAMDATESEVQPQPQNPSPQPPTRPVKKIAVRKRNHM